MTVQSWRDFEVFTCGLFDGLMPSAIIAHDLRVKDEHGISHQIDVDIRIPHENKLITIMLDTKLQKKKVGKGDIQKLAKTRDQLGYHLAGVVANRLDGFSRDAKKQASLDDGRLFDLSHWLIVATGDWEFGVTGGGPFSDEFIAGTRVVRVMPTIEGPLFHHPHCQPDCRAPSFDWVTEPGATVGETIRLWLDEGRIQGWREEAREDAAERIGALSEGEVITRNFAIGWDDSLPLRHPDSPSFDGYHTWHSYVFVTELEVFPASAKRTEWFLRRLGQGEWRFLAVIGTKPSDEQASRDPTLHSFQANHT